MPYSLVVIDMQRGFLASNKRSTIDNCKVAITKAIDDEADIIYLEYIGVGRTMKCLTDISDDYWMANYIRKSDCSGAEEIKSVKRAYNLRTDHFKICGVNTDACVQFTVLGLSKLFESSVIEVLARACNSQEGHKYGLEVMESYHNVVINNQKLVL